MFPLYKTYNTLVEGKDLLINIKSNSEVKRSHQILENNIEYHKLFTRMQCEVNQNIRSFYKIILEP
jgi:hypothetical protein